VALSFWLQLALTGVVGVLALIKASASQGDTGGTIGFLIFLAAIAYAFWLIKSAFDRIDRSGH
jgi:hypothetical protein